MSLPKKLAIFALLAAVPYATAQTVEPEIEINFEPNSNLEVVIQHTKGFLDADNDFYPQLERDATLTKDDNQILNTNEDGYSYAIEEKEAEEFHCDCQDNQDNQHHVTNDDDYEAEYGQVFVDPEEETHDQDDNNNIQVHLDDEDYDENQDIEACDCQDDHAGNGDEKIEYDGFFMDNEEEHHENKDQPNDEEKEIEECNCNDDQDHANDDDYEADYDQIVVESEADDIKDDNKMDNFLSPDGDIGDVDEDEMQDCDCEDDKSDADDEDYDADLDEIFIESEVEAEKDEREEEEKRQKNLRAAALLAEKDEDIEKPVEDQEDLMIVVTYDQIMAQMSQEEREIEEKTGEPFYKRMYDLVLGKETQKELEAANILEKPKHYYDGL